MKLIYIKIILKIILKRIYVIINYGNNDKNEAIKESNGENKTETNEIK